MEIPMSDNGESILVVTEDFQYYIPNLPAPIRPILQPVTTTPQTMLTLADRLTIPPVQQSPQINSLTLNTLRSQIPMDIGEGLHVLGNICMATQQERMILQPGHMQTSTYTSQLPLNDDTVPSQQVTDLISSPNLRSNAAAITPPPQQQTHDSMTYQSEAFKAALMIMNTDQDNMEQYQTVQLGNVNLNMNANTNMLPLVNANDVNSFNTLNSLHNVNNLNAVDPQTSEITIGECQITTELTTELRNQFELANEIGTYEKDEDKSPKKKEQVGKEGSTVVLAGHKSRKKTGVRKPKIKSCHFCKKELIWPDKSVLFKIDDHGKSIFFDTCDGCLEVENNKFVKKNSSEINHVPFDFIVAPAAAVKSRDIICEVCGKHVFKIVSILTQIVDGKIVYKNACNVCSMSKKPPEEKPKKTKRKKKKLPVKKETTGDGETASLQEEKAHKNIGTQVEEDPYKWKCSSCSKVFGSKTELQKHRRQSHRYYRLFQCDNCPNRIKIYSPTEIVKCNQCGKEFDQTKYSPYTLSKQFYVKRSIQELKCPICQKIFSSRRGVIEHQKIHSNLKPHLCNICGRTFRSLPPLRIHMRVHTGEKPYKCEMCGKCFRQSSALNMHVRHHTGETPYSCEICSKKFARRSQYTKHMESHTEKTFECAECNKKFPTEVRLKRHHRKHTDENPYRCHICGMNYEENSAYRRHMQKHDAMNPHRCEICGKQFGGRRGLLEHSSVHQGNNEFKCGICSNEYLNKNELDTHIATHFKERPFNCTHCDLTFSTKSLLEHHCNFHVPNGEFFECAQCKKKFTKRVTLDMHMRRHNGPKPFKCYLCGEEYLWSTTLDSHMKTHYGHP